jgi:ATP-dependent DNA helicase UvrD/PcrA
VTPAARFDVLIHAPFYGALRAFAPEARARFRRLVERLRAGAWGGGTRVKKLRGCPKPVFEARQDAGDRVLFTLAHTAARDGSATLRPHLMLWDLVPHDRISARARRVNPSAEAEFLDFEEMEAEEVTEPPPHPAASFQDIAAEGADTEAGVVELMLASDGSVPRPREEITGGVRWYVVPDRLLVDEARWQELMDSGAEELELKLTAEQYAVVRAPGPVLLSGSAGSGKTTIAVHRLAAAMGAASEIRALYVTYSTWLRDHARRLFHDLLACRGDVLPASPDFLTVHELYRTLIGETAAAPLGGAVDYPEFARWYEGQFRRADAALAWEEIRGIVKGANLDPTRALLPRGDYEALGRKRAPAFVGERVRLYHVARRWQDYLEAGRRLDEIDLCRLALAAVPAGGLYDHLVCDEAQDLAEIQMELLLRLMARRSLAGLFLAGDPQQVINPSGFRWAEIRSRIRERFLDRGRPAPDLRVLTRNFRSVRGLVELANEVLAFKRDRTGRSEGDEAEQSEVAGAAPILVVGEETALADAIRGFGPRCAVVAGSADIRERLQTALETTRVFTVPEAKGLEFDVAILWGVVAADPEPWRKLLDPLLTLREDPSARRTLHHLYVAVTRARRHLAVYEPPGAPPVWSAERFAARLDPEPPTSLSRLFVRSAAPDEWAREADYFLERGRYRQAAECFRRAGDARREAESLARHHEAAGEHVLAAERWRTLGETARAARCFEAGQRWAEAAADWSRLGDEVGPRRCHARLAEVERRWGDAAAGWEAIEAWEDAARCWAGTGQRNRQVRCLAVAAEKAGRPADAARRWEEIEEWDCAVAAWEAAGREREAWLARARGHEAGRRWDDAAAAWERAGDPDRALRCRAEAAAAAGRWETAARAWEQLGEYQRAIRTWQQAGRQDESQRCAVRRDLAEGRFARAAEALEEQGDLAAASDAWSRAGSAGQQPLTPRRLPLPAAAMKAWGEGGKAARLARAVHSRVWSTRGNRPSAIPGARLRELVCAVRAAEDSGRFEDAAAAWKSLGDPEQTLRCRVTHLDRGGDVAGAARLLESRERYADAAASWARAGEGAEAARCLALLDEKRGRLAEAALAWEKLGQPARAARCRANLCFRRGEYEEAARGYDAAGEAEMAVTARVLAAKLRGSYEAADRAVRESGLEHMRNALLGDRRAWLAEARALAAGHAQARSRGARGSETASRVARPASRRGRRRVAEARGWVGSPAETDGTADASTAILDAVRRSPGLTCEDIAHAVGTATDRVKPLLAALTVSGRLRKEGRTRGTRYLPA